jgi:hypothetical protein
MLRGLLTAGLVVISLSCCTADAASAAVRLARGKDVPSGAMTVKVHAYGLDAAELTAHPEWQLKDASHRPLYIGTLAAADFGNAAFRTWWIAKTQAALGLSAKGLFIDDVFMERRTTTSGGASSLAIDPRTGVAITEANWQKYMADFMVAVRAALPGSVEIMHDVLWYKGDGGDVLRGLQAANSVSLEGGFTTNVSYGTGTYGIQTLSNWVEREQARGRAVVLDNATTTPATRLFELATALLVDKGAVAIANDASTAPGAVWSGYAVDPGQSYGDRYPVTANGLWRRDFARAIVLVNEPLRSARTVTVGAGWQDLDGVARTSVTLAGGQSTVLVPIPPAPIPTPTPTPALTPTPVAPTSDKVSSVPTPTPTPVAPVATPTKITTVTTGGDGAAKARTTGKAGARAPGETSVSVRGSSRRLSGRVRGAVAGYVRLTVERKRGSRWVVVLRTKGSVKQGGTFARDIPRLRGGAYRVSGYYGGTGTSRPSRSSAKPFRA